jgi:hypothetical protein
VFDVVRLQDLHQRRISPFEGTSAHGFAIQRRPYEEGRVREARGCRIQTPDRAFCLADELVGPFLKWNGRGQGDGHEGKMVVRPAEVVIMTGDFDQ